MAKNIDFIQWLRDHGACGDGIDWAVKNKIKDADEAWRKLHRTDWMFWLAEARKSELMKDDKNLRLFAADCAEAVLPIYEKAYPNEKAPRLAIQAARDFAKGKITAEQLAAAWAAAWDAARAAARAAAWDAARDAARAAAWDAARDAAWDAARAAAWDAAWDAARAAQAKNLRKYFKKL